MLTIMDMGLPNLGLRLGGLHRLLFTDAWNLSVNGRKRYQGKGKRNVPDLVFRDHNFQMRMSR